MFLTVILFPQSSQLVRLGAFRLTFTGTTFTLFKLSTLTERFFSTFFLIFLDLIFNISPLPLLEWVSTCFANLFFAEQLLHNQGSDSGRYMYLKKAFPDEISCMEIQGFFRVEILYYPLRDTAKYVFL